MKAEILPSGLMVPAQPKPEPKKYGPLEITDDGDRNEASKLLAKLLNLSAMRGGILRDGSCKERSALVRAVAELLLPGFDCEMKC